MVEFLEIDDRPSPSVSLWNDEHLAVESGTWVSGNLSHCLFPQQ